ncbi:hypothetical protein NDA13_004945 [Ustilago tritici]|nr:hypothetical protein NDA13_004945 [Ustilago tritici]
MNPFSSTFPATLAEPSYPPDRSLPSTNTYRSPHDVYGSGPLAPSSYSYHSPQDVNHSRTHIPSTYSCRSPQNVNRS